MFYKSSVKTLGLKLDDSQVLFSLFCICPGLAKSNLVFLSLGFKIKEREVSHFFLLFWYIRLYRPLLHRKHHKNSQLPFLWENFSSGNKIIVFNSPEASDCYVSSSWSVERHEVPGDNTIMGNMRQLEK